MKRRTFISEIVPKAVEEVQLPKTFITSDNNIPKVKPFVEPTREDDPHGLLTLENQLQHAI